jgi:RecA-family ATPase
MMSGLLKAALGYAKLGWPVFPCNGNKPRLKGGFHAATTDQDQIQRWWGEEFPDANIGLACNGPLWALDVDPDKGGDESLNQLEATFGSLPETVTNLSGNDGWHLIFKHDGTPIKNGVNVAGDGLDVRSDGYIILPPSLHPNGRTYEWQADNSPFGMEPSLAPDWLKKIVAKDDKRPLANQLGISTNYGFVALQDECSKVRNAPNGIQEKTLNEAGLKIGGLVNGGELDHAEATSALIDAGLSMTNFDPVNPWTKPQISYKLDRAISAAVPRSSSKSFHSGGPLEPFERSHPIIDWGALEGSPPAREWIWGDLIPKGHVTTFYGDGGTGKTLIAQQLATKIAEPKQDNLVDVFGFLDMNITSGPVIGLFAEDDIDELWRRQNAINGGYGLTNQDLEALHVMSGYGEYNLLMTFDRQEGKLTPLYSHIKAMALDLKPELIIIDNAADTFAGVENDRNAVNQFIKVCLGGLAKETGASVLLLAHPSVAGMQSNSGMGGSTAWSNSVRSRLYLERLSGEDEDYDESLRRLSLRKSNYSALGTSKLIKWQDGIFIPVNEDKKEVSTWKEKKKAVLEELGLLLQKQGHLSPNSRAGNYAAKRLQNSEPLRKLKLRKKDIERVLDSLMREDRIAIKEYWINGRAAQTYEVNEKTETKNDPRVGCL